MASSPRKKIKDEAPCNLESVIAQTSHPRSAERYNALVRSESLSDDEQAAIARLLSADNDLTVRNQALAALTNVGNRQDAFRIRLSLRDPSWIVRSTAIETAAEILGRSATQDLVPLLNDRHPIVRRDAATYLAEIGAEEALGDIRKRLAKEKHPRALVGLFFALAYFGDNEALRKLMDLRSSSVPGLNESLMECIKRIIEDGKSGRDNAPIILEFIDRVIEKGTKPPAMSLANEIRQLLS